MLLLTLLAQISSSVKPAWHLLDVRQIRLKLYSNLSPAKQRLIIRSNYRKSACNVFTSVHLISLYDE